MAEVARPVARPYIGGQAVLEGVMMRSPHSYAVVVRRRDGTLHVRERAMVAEDHGIRKAPFVRGLASLGESLKLGSDALKFSAELAERDMEAAEREASAKTAKAAAQGAGPAHKALMALTLALMSLDAGGDAGDEDAGEHGAEDGKARPGSKGAMTVMIVLMVGLLVAMPQAAAAGVARLMHLELEVQSPAFQALTGAFKLTIVVSYLLLIRRLADIRRVFQYHGAEHKTISTYEAGEALTVDNARAKTTLHPRCGTTFLVMVALVSIFVFTGVGALLPRIHTGNAALDQLVFFLEKLPFVPLIASVTFEIQRLFARHCTTGPLRVLLWPGFLCQKITTIEPDDDQLEVALASLRATLFREEGKRGAEGDTRFADFHALMTAPQLRKAA